MDEADTVNKPRSRDTLIDAWRAFSVILVILHHALTFRFQTHSVLDTLFGGYTGAIGVQFFFVISGYLITRLLMQEFHRNGRVSLAAFFVRRAFRILPPLWLMLGTVLVLVKLGFFYISANGFLSPVLFITNYVHGSEWPIRHTWSLGVEEQFYIVWPVVLVLLSFRGIGPMSLALSVSLTLLAGLPLAGEFDNPTSFACIAMGCCYCANDAFRSLLHRAARGPVILAAWLLVFGSPFFGHVFPGQTTLQNILQAPLDCFLIFSSFRYRTLLERSGMIRCLAVIGTFSYGLYLWQQIFLAPPGVYLIPIPWQAVMLLPLIAGLSSLFFERPLIRLGARLSVRLTENGKATPTLVGALPPSSPAH